MDLNGRDVTQVEEHLLVTSLREVLQRVVEKIVEGALDVVQFFAEFLRVVDVLFGCIGLKCTKRK